MGFQKYGSEVALAANPIKHLYEIYVKINQDAKSDATVKEEARAYFKKMEEGDFGMFEAILVSLGG